VRRFLIPAPDAAPARTSPGRRMLQRVGFGMARRDRAH
jgi:hypothetical protein